MDVQQQRGRSPSAGHRSDHLIRHSPSPQPFRDPNSSAEINTAAAFISPQNGGGPQYNLSASYLNSNPGPVQFQQAGLPNQDFNEHNFARSFPQSNASPLNPQANSQFQTDVISVSPDFNPYASQQDINPNKQAQFENNFLLDPQLQSNAQQADQSINPAEIMSNMSSPQNMHPTPPGLMPPGARSSEPTSPFTGPGQQWSPNHSRQASLDPSMAYVNGGQGDWTRMLQGQQFQGHRRAPSEYSDVSSSVAPSPHITQHDNFDNYDQSRSPMVHPQADSQNYTDGLGIETFSISDPQPGPSPRHSPFVSPMISPQAGMGAAQNQSFAQLSDSKGGFNNGSVTEPFPHQPEQFPQFPPEQRLPSNDFPQMAPPEINVELAPPSTSRPFDVPRFEGDFDALSPPDRSLRNRMRAKSDTYISRPVTPVSNVATLGSNDSLIDRRSRSGSLSPLDVPSISRESSPGARSPGQRRSSTSSIPNRDYILDLADPNRPTAPGTTTRVQKHPATFQCHLCPKKFTRAYNLRSHLRTHTDERPFVCSVCSKAFARQHDRKRHEGLHSGEKKFVCRGELGTGTTWGCGRRFARADALGRHFRSEAGRVCIKPLLDEEAMERQRTMDEQMMNQNMQMGGLAPAAAMNGMNQGVFTLPAALLQQYPALQGLQWDQLPAGPDDDISGRSSFDASSGGDYYEDDDDASGYMSDNPINPGFETGGVWQGGQGWRSDVEA